MREYILKGIPSDLIEGSEIGNRKLKTSGIDPALINEYNTGSRLAVENIDQIQTLILDGFGFYLNMSFGNNPEFGDTDTEIPANGFKFVEITMPSDRITLFSDRFITTNVAESHYRIFTDYGPTTFVSSIPTFPLRYNTNYQPSVQFDIVTTDETLINPASRIVNVGVYGIEGQGGRQSGDSAAESSLRLISPGSKILVLIQNSTPSPAKANIDFRWGEIPTELVRDPFPII